MSKILPLLVGALLALPAPAQKRDGFQREGNAKARVAKDRLEGRTPPPLQVSGWLNAPKKGLRLADLRGKVVVLDFWGVW